MKTGLAVWIVAGGVLLLTGCTREPGSTVLTKGVLTIECDEAVAPIMRLEVEEFQRQYTESEITLRVVEAREAIANFAADSVRVIVTARALNAEEKSALEAGNVMYEEYHVAQSAVAAIAHRDNPMRKVRMGQLDSIFSGVTNYWPDRRRETVIDLAVGDVNSSTNEVFRGTVMDGKRFARSATPITSSSEIFEYVYERPDAIGIIGLAWLKGVAEGVTVMAVGRPGVSPDSTQPPGLFYSPAAAYVFKGYYAISTPVYMYTREVSRDLGLGFIAFVMGSEGQKVINRNGLVPVTMPVRLIQLSSEQVEGQ
ncbi:MAG: substrate-binding domain-containing protein [Bacteroidota bacterium]